MQKFQTKHLASMAGAISQLPAHMNPLRSPAAAAKVHPSVLPKLQAIQANPALHNLATNGQGSTAAATNAINSGAGGSGMAPPAGATSAFGGGSDPADPTGTRVHHGGTGWGAGAAQGIMRDSRVRHVLLGFTALTLTAGQTGALAKATPTVDFKPNRMIAMPGVTGTIQNIQSGIAPQYVSGAAEDLDMYQPVSYGGEVDLDPVDASVPINAFVNNGNATAAQTFYGAFIGEAVGIEYREFSSKIMAGSLGTSGSVSASGTGTLTLTPLIRYTTRKISVTPGASFSDAFVITAITAGIQNQLMSGDPIPASVFSDLFPLFVDFDVVKPSVPLAVSYQNVSAGAATLKGTTRGDVDPSDLVRFKKMTDVGGA